jgi:phosphatidylserine/phosphatidylglycerophosphate/cardiolipin synthase-like enzyme
MAVFLTTRGTTAELEKIINGAENFLVLISPFIKMPSSLLQNLKAADKRGVNISVVYGKSQLEPDTVRQLTELRNAKLYFFDNLHAKCYFNEKSMVITSLNLYDFSEVNNREMGVLVTRQEADGVYAEAAREARMIVDLAVRCEPNTQVTERPKIRVPAPKKKEKPKSIWRKDLSEILSSFMAKSNGYCIGCRTRIDFDEDRPYCPACYAKWQRDRRQKGLYCHECSQPATTTINKFRCRSCYDKSSL